MTHRINVGPLRGSRLVEDYLEERESALRFFSGSPFSLPSYQERLEVLRNRFGREEREQAAAALHPTTPGAERRLSRFVEEGGAVITTGQQAGLFGGPLYTLYKAVTAIELASALERELGTVVLPVFWTASEDHDWEEVNHLHLVGKGGDLRKISLGPGGYAPVAVGERLLDVDIESALGEVEYVIAGEQHAAWILRLLRGAYRPGRSPAEAFSRLMADLFRGEDLLLTDAADPALKRSSVPVLRAELRNAARHEKLVAEQTRALVSAGYSPQAAIIEGATNLFFHGPAGRERVHRARAGGFRLRDSGTLLSQDELETLLRDAPHRLSPNVFLRPAVESAVFPVLSYVAGPGEIGYFAQLRQMMAALNMEVPLVFPRASILIVEPEVQDALRRLDLEAVDLAIPRHELVSRIARERMPPALGRGFEALRAATVDGFQTLLEDARDVEETLAGAVGASRNRVLLEIAAAERKVLAAVKRASERDLRTLDFAHVNLRPGGQPQERGLGALLFLARHGPEFLRMVSTRVRESSALSLRRHLPAK